MGMLLALILILLLLGAAPAWPYSRSWGYGPSGLVGVLLVILIIMLFAYPTFIPWGFGPAAGPVVVAPHP
jgi:hypothetical protein